MTPTHYDIAQMAWSAFTSHTPYPWYRLLFNNLEAIPHLKSTIKRVLEEYPDIKSGLSRTEYQALLTISHGIETLKDIYVAVQKMEELPFMGEEIFLYNINAIIDMNLVKHTKDGRGFEMTSFGRAILDGEDFLYNYHQIDRWIGGVHITNSNLWCWDRDSSSISER